MYAPHKHAQDPCHRVLPVACSGFLTVPQGGMSAPPTVSLALKLDTAVRCVEFFLRDFSTEFLSRGSDRAVELPCGVMANFRDHKPSVKFCPAHSGAAQCGKTRQRR